MISDYVLYSSMLRLNPSTLSTALGNQLLVEGSHLRAAFHDKLLPEISNRLLDSTLQRSNSGSIQMGSALSLFLAAYKRSPRVIAEVGTYIGNSSAAIGFGTGISGQSVQLITCDLHPCTKTPLAGITLPQGSKAHVMHCSSTKMFQSLMAQQVKLDMLNLDGRLMHDDIKLLGNLLKEDTLITLDDCEGDEKGHMNLDLLRRAGLIKHHVFVEPFPQKLFRAWNLETRSTTGFLLPMKLISFSRQ